mgnify:CR=1 FL=1
MLLFVIAIFVPSGFWTVAFDTGGVTTGSITVPLMLALGAGVASMRENGKSETDSFGISGICSIGPIITVLILGLFYPLAETFYDAFRILHKNDNGYTYWDYSGGAFVADLGMRIDYLMLSASLADKLKSCRVMKNIRALPRPSDHAPLMAEFEEF